MKQTRSQIGMATGLPVKHSNGLVVIAVVIAAFFLWNFFTRGDSQPTSQMVSDAVFQNTYLGDSDGHRDNSYCFGLGGGQESSHPCVFIVGFRSTGTNKSSESCFDISYIAEGNYGVTNEELPSNHRYFPYESAPFDINVCGKFQTSFAHSHPNGQIPDDWEFVSDTYPSALIQADLKSKGYVW